MRGERGGMGAAEGVGYGSGLGYMGYISCMVTRFHGYMVISLPGAGWGRRGNGRADAGKAAGRQPGSHQVGRIGRRQGQDMRRPDFRQVGPAGPHHVKPQHGEQGPRPAGQQVGHRPAGLHAMDHVARPADDNFLINIVPDNAKLLNDDLPDPEREIRGQGVRAELNELIECAEALLGGRRGAGSGDHGG